MTIEDILSKSTELLTTSRCEYQAALQKSVNDIYDLAEQSDGVETREGLSKFFDGLKLKQDIPLDFLKPEVNRHEAQAHLTEVLKETCYDAAQLEPTGWVSRGFSYLSRTVGVADTLRSSLKQLLPKRVAESTFRDIDGPLNDLLCAKAKLIGSHLGVIAALELYEKTFVAHEVRIHHFMMLSRHEICTNLTKSFGLSPDTDLTAKNPSMFETKVQSKLELYAARVVKETMVDCLNRLYVNSCNVRVISSPVSRALSTATEAGLDAAHVNAFHVSHQFSEQKLSSRNPTMAFFSSFITSGTERSTPDEIRERLVKLGYNSNNITFSDFTAEDSARSTQENQTQYTRRVTHAAQELKRAPRPDSNGLTWVFSHGDLLQDLAQEITGTEIKKLDYGDTYLMIAHNSTVRCMGIMNRFGRVTYQSKPELAVSRDEVPLTMSQH
jgi:broad specificity phosphatase PhoE